MYLDSFTFRNTTRYIKEHLFKTALVLFSLQLLCTIISYFAVTISCSHQIEEIFSYLQEVFNEDGMLEKQGFDLFFGLFKHNSVASIGSMLYGTVPFLFLPMWSTVQNGMVGGMVYGLGAFVSEESIFLTWLKYVLPHGIFEIPATALADAMGFHWCLLLTKKILGRAKGESVLYHLKHYFSTLIFYVFPLLLVAAFIEGIVEHIVFGI